MTTQSSGIGLAIIAISSACHAQSGAASWKLAGDQQPSEPALWQQPATISYARENGKAKGNVDADLRYTHKGVEVGGKHGWHAWTYAAGAFVHRDTNDKAPKNDRGLSFRLGQTYRLGASDPTRDNSPADVDKIDFLIWSIGAKLGKSLVSSKDAAGTTNWFDKKSARLVAQGDYYLIPKTQDRPRAPDLQFNVSAGAYHDRLSGVGEQSGNLSGVFGKVRLDWAVWGLDPSANTFSNRLGMAPVLYAAAQVQKDIADSADRKKDRYTLYSVGLSLNFSKLGEDTIVPSLVIERSIGADLLTGRAKTGKTTVAFGLAF